MATSITTNAGNAIADDDDEAMMPVVRKTQLGIFPPEIDFRFPLRKPIKRT